MSRSGYSDDCDHLELYRANVWRAIHGKRGQKLMLDMLRGLDQMEKRELHAYVLLDDIQFDDHPRMCALGAAFQQRGVRHDDLDIESPKSVADRLGVSWMVAAEVAHMNDEWFRPETPSERWNRMRLWVISQLTPDNREAYEDEAHR